MTILTLPTWSEFLAGTQAWASGPFTEFLPIAYITIGLTGAALLLLWFKDTIIGAIHYVFRNKSEDDYDSVTYHKKL